MGKTIRSIERGSGMTIEQKLEILKKAIKMGACINVSFFELNSEIEAKVKAEEFQGLEYKKQQRDDSQWLKYESNNFEIVLFYDKSTEERKQELLAELEFLQRCE